MNKLIFGILAFFVLAQIIGLFTGLTLFKDMFDNPYVRPFYEEQQMVSQGPESALYLIGYTLIGAVVIVLLVRKVRNEFIFRIMEFILISTASSLVFYSFLRLALNYEQSIIGGIIFGLSIAIAKQFFPAMKNLATVLAAAGAGALFGTSFGFVPAMLFLVLISVYDYIAVFKTKHMVELADYMVKKDLSFTVTSKAVLPKEKKERRMDLGSGDLMLPVMISVSSMTISPIASLLVFIGATLSIGIFLEYVSTKKAVFPALPPIAAGIIIFLFLGYVLGMY
jgi:presenilin-like A22 family membrane protease